MELAVALNSTRRRDLRFFEGDGSVINVTVYQNDGDTVPIPATDVSLAWGYNGSALATGSNFLVGFYPRSPYSIRGTVNGQPVTLAYGLINRFWDPAMYACCSYWDGQIFDHLTPPNSYYADSYAPLFA